MSTRLHHGTPLIPWPAPLTAQSSQPSTPVRLGVMMDSFDVPGWLHYLLEQIMALKTLELALVVVQPRPSVPAGQSPLLFRVWAALDKRVRLSRTDALQQRNCEALLTREHSVPVLLLSATEGQLTKADDAEIRSANLDLILNLGGGTVKPGLPECSRLGIWSLECSSSLKCDECELRTVPSAFREMCSGKSVFTCGLRVVVRRRESADTLFQASGITNFLSLALNQNTAFWKVTDYLLTQLSDAERLRSGQTQWESSFPDTDSPCPRSTTLSNLQMTRFLARWSMRVLRNEAEKRLFREQWFLAVRRRNSSAAPTDARGFKIIKPPRSRFYADPFLIERNGRTYLFFEEYPFATSKGLISCCELHTDGTVSEPRVVLEREYHLSYPFLLEFGGEVYMIPETRDNRTIEMYRAKEFPYSWVPHKILMEDVTAADTTLLYHNDRWWLFTAGVLDRHSLNETLCLFHADSPFGPWKSHPKNPIVCDPRRARPAGCLFYQDGHLIRPGQDCSNGYGYAIQLHRVERLSEKEYQETPLERITPDWISGNRGTHTINHTDAYQVLDARSLISRCYLRSPFSALPQDRNWLQQRDTIPALEPDTTGGNVPETR